MRNRDFIKSRGIGVMRAFLGDGQLTAEGQFIPHRERVPAHAGTLVAPGGR